MPKPTPNPTPTLLGIISGSVKAAGGAPLANVIFKLHAGNRAGAVIVTTMTGPNGQYEFTGLLPGEYVVEETNPPDYSINFSDQDNTPDGDIGDHDTTVDNLISVTLTDGEVDTGNDFVNARTPTPKPTPNQHQGQHRNRHPNPGPTDTQTDAQTNT
jgi:hypothetical protein